MTPLLVDVIVTLQGDRFSPLNVTGWMLRDCPGLAVTPARLSETGTSLTYYCITHTPSGRRIGGQYTPFDAVNLMAELHTLDIDWTLPASAFGKGGIPYRTINEIVNRYDTAEDED